jgi:hypothetical protein
MGSQSIPNRTPTSNSACRAEKRFSGEVGLFATKAERSAKKKNAD